MSYSESTVRSIGRRVQPVADIRRVANSVREAKARIKALQAEVVTLKADRDTAVTAIQDLRDRVTALEAL